MRFVIAIFVCAFLPLMAGCPGSGSGAASTVGVLPEAVWLETGTGPGQTVYPRAIAYDSNNDWFYVVDRQARVQRLDRNGKFLAGWAMPDFRQGKPVGLSVGPDGLLYVPDTHYHRVVVFDKDGNEVRRWGQKGTGPGEFIYPTDIAFANGELYVGEYGDDDRIQVFTPDGKYLRQFGKFGQGDGEFSRPQSLVILGDEMYLTDACNHRICVFKLDGTFVRNMGSVGEGPGQFRFPYGLDADREGNLLVTEFGNNRVQKISREGKSLAIWGTAGRAVGELAYPWAAVADGQGRVVIVDSGNNRLQLKRF